MAGCASIFFLVDKRANDGPRPAIRKHPPSPWPTTWDERSTIAKRKGTELCSNHQLYRNVGAIQNGGT